MSTTPFVPSCRPWLHEPLEVLEPPLAELALVAGEVVAAPGWLAAPGLLLPPEEPHPAMVSTTAKSSVTVEIAEIVRDIRSSSFRWPRRAG
jgi:hypothetical protein